MVEATGSTDKLAALLEMLAPHGIVELVQSCLLYTSDAADERSSVDLGGRRIIKTKKHTIALKRRNT